MSRPVRARTIYRHPCCRRFEPVPPKAQYVNLTVDELEALRLVDLIQLDQSAAAARMQVGRSTMQNIITSAHQKVAMALTSGMGITIAGGHVEYSQDTDWGCARDGSPVKEGNMKIAVPYENGQVFQHFGKSEQFAIYTVEGKTVKQKEIVSTNGQGHGALAGLLSGLAVDVVIAGGIGGGAVMALQGAGITCYAGAQGDTDEAVKALLEGNLAPSEGPTCGCHHGGEGCGHHDGGGCGHHC